MIGHPPLTGVLWLNASEIVACGDRSVVVSSTHSIDGHWKYGGGGGGGGSAPPHFKVEGLKPPPAPPISPPLPTLAVNPLANLR